MINILKRAEFDQLPKEEQKQQMETWREHATNRDIYNAMGTSSDSYYKLCRTLNVKPKTVQGMDTTVAKEEETEVEMGTEIEQSNVSNPLSLQLSVENTLNKEQATQLFDSIISFLSNQGEYCIKVEISR